MILIRIERRDEQMSGARTPSRPLNSGGAPAAIPGNLPLESCRSLAPIHSTSAS